MLVFTDKGKLKKRIKELEKSLEESEYNEEQLRKQVKRLVSEITSMDYRHEADEERWAEKLESYEESLKRRDLTIADIKEEESERYTSLYDSFIETRKLLDSFVERCIGLESENNSLKVELNGAEREVERLKEQSKSPYPSVVINVDVRDTLTKQLVKSLKQVNEAFEKRSKEKRYIFSCEGLDYSSENRTELARCVDSMYKLSLHDYASLVRLLESLEKELEHKDFANGGRSFYSNKLQERVFITLKATKEEIQMGYLTKGQVIALTVGIATVFGAILVCCFGFFVLLFGAATVFQFLGVVWVLFAAKHFIDATFKLYDKAKEEFLQDGF